MVTKRIRSEYMKKFKDPKWETYSKCYEEMLRYRLTRRLLEHTHNPWFWSGSDTDSDSTGTSPPPGPPGPPGLPGPAGPPQNQVGEEAVEPELEECEAARTSRDPELVPRLQLPEDEDAAAAKDSEHPRPQQQQTKPPKPSKPARPPPRVRPAPSRQSKQEVKGSRHSFALYASGERDANVGSRRTHNVGPVASTDEIHESALRAKTKREAERQIQSQRAAERRRAKSADQGPDRKLLQPHFDPWVTEYMRCFSSRSR